MQAQAIVLDDSRVTYRESKIGNDFFLGGGGQEMEDFTGPKVSIEWLNFTAAQSAKVSNSGTQDDSPVWGTATLKVKIFVQWPFGDQLFGFSRQGKFLGAKLY